MASSRSGVVLSLFLGAAGTAHLVRPSAFAVMIPRSLPGSPRLWIYGTGAAELGLAAAVAAPSTRRLGALASAAWFVGVLPGNVTMAHAAFRDRRPTGVKAARLARLPLQLPLVAWALRVSRVA